MKHQNAPRDIASDVAPFPLVDAAGVPPRDRSNDAAAMDLIRRWLDLSELERRAFVALTRELSESSDLVETSTLDLSERFQTLAHIAQTQIGQVETIVAMAKSIEVDDKPMPLQTAMESVEGVLRRFIETILAVSKHAMRMVYALDDVTKDVDGTEQCVVQIKTINTQIRYLALNAAIEANRSGAAGAAFGVIAHELKELSHATERTSRDVQTRIASITRGVRSGHTVLQELATIDMSEQIIAKEWLEKLIAGIVAQNRSFTEVLATTAGSSAEMARTVGQLITGMQFQDRTKQHFEHVIAVLAVLEEATRSAQEATSAAYPGRFECGLIDQEWLQRIVSGQTLGAMKQRILTRLLTDGDPEHDTDRNAGDQSGETDGGIELF